jgi:hypothetical protein
MLTFSLYNVYTLLTTKLAPPIVVLCASHSHLVRHVASHYPCRHNPV